MAIFSCTPVSISPGSAVPVVATPTDRSAAANSPLLLVATTVRVKLSNATSAAESATTVTSTPEGLGGGGGGGGLGGKGFDGGGGGGGGGGALDCIKRRRCGALASTALTP
jgi:uncharacterized membrane protein YgcG